MSNPDFDLNAALKRIEQEFASRFPEYSGLSGKEIARKALAEGKITEAALAELYSKAFNVPVLEEDEIVLPENKEEFSLAFFNAHDCVALEFEEDMVTLLVASPYTLGEIAFQMKRMWKCDIAVRFVRKPFLERLLSKLQNAEEEAEEEKSAEDENTLRTLAGEARIVRLVNDIFTRALELGASDIHIEPGEDSVSVRCRVDGVLTEIINVPLNQFPAIASRIKLLGGLNIAESRLPQDGRTNVSLGRLQLDMRISTIPILTGESIVLRLLNKERAPVC